MCLVVVYVGGGQHAPAAGQQVPHSQTPLVAQQQQPPVRHGVPYDEPIPGQANYGATAQQAQVQHGGKKW